MSRKEFPNLGSFVSDQVNLLRILAFPIYVKLITLFIWQLPEKQMCFFCYLKSTAKKNQHRSIKSVEQDADRICELFYSRFSFLELINLSNLMKSYILSEWMYGKYHYCLLMITTCKIYISPVLFFYYFITGNLQIIYISSDSTHIPGTLYGLYKTCPTDRCTAFCFEILFEVNTEAEMHELESCCSNQLIFQSNLLAPEEWSPSSTLLYLLSMDYMHESWDEWNTCYDRQRWVSVIPQQSGQCLHILIS